MIGNDIQCQIDIHKSKLEIYNIAKDYLLKSMMGGPTEIKPISYEGMPSGQGAKTVTLDRQWQEMQRLQNMIDLEVWAIDKLEVQLQKMKVSIDDLKGIDYKVKYMRDYMGLSLQEIARKTKYDYAYIKNVSCRNPRG